MEGTYGAYLHTTNVIASLFAFLLGASIIPFLANVAYTWLFAEATATNPWRSRGLEWQTLTPVPLDNFEHVPQIAAGPYEYGVAGGRPMIQELALHETTTSLTPAGS